MEEEFNLPEPKISLPEAFLIGFALLAIDALQIVLGFFALDDFWILDFFVGSIFFYLAIKGIPPLRQLVGWIIELVPYVGAFLPINTVAWCMTVWADRNPTSLAAKTTAAAAAFTPKGGVAAKTMARMERQEETARRYLRVPARATPESQASGEETSPSTPAAPPRGGGGELYAGQNPYAELNRMLEETPRVEKQKKESGRGVAVDENGTVDLREATL